MFDDFISRFQSDELLDLLREMDELNGGILWNKKIDKRIFKKSP